MDEMIEKPKRPTLRLKFPPKLPDPPAARAPAVKAPPAQAWAPAKSPASPPPEWKCKPCGTAFGVPADAGDEDWVRCPSCNARLGLARDFRQTPPNIAKLRARAVAPAPVAKR